MNELIDYLAHRLDFLATTASVIATIVGFLALGVRPRREVPRVGKATAERPTIDDGVTERLDEARQALKQQSALAKAHRVGGGMLTFGQFIVGGLLASSFVQQQTSKTLIGVL